MASAKIKVAGIKSAGECVEIINEIARLEIEEQKKEVQLKKQVQALQDKVAPEIDQLNEQIDGLMARIAPYVEDHGEEMFKPGQKEGETTLAKFGIRMGNPTVGKLAKWTWDDVLAALKQSEEFAYLVKTKEEVAKSLVLAKMPEERMAEFGMKVTQTERVWVEPKAEAAV